MRRVCVNDFLTVDPETPVIDVRSPSEYEEGHIAGATNIPIFSDEERALVGTVYTKVGKDRAIDLGLEIVGPKMHQLANKGKIIGNNGKLKVHCWRGGMRSDKMAWLFELVGLEVTVLEGGYKAFRQQLLESFQKLEKLLVLQGPTGSGKTKILHELQKQGEQIIDLEKRANHKGSAFGALGMKDQPGTVQFQNLLFNDLNKLNWNKRIWVESESLSIGKVYLPETLWDNMNESDVIELSVPKEIRADRIVEEYGHFGYEQLSNSIEKIKNRFGGNRVKEALSLLQQNELKQVVLLLLSYYDKAYSFSKNKYKKDASAILHAETGDPELNARNLIKLADKLKL